MNFDWIKIIETVIVVGLVLLAQRVVRASTTRIVETRELKPSRGKFIYRFISSMNLAVGGFLLISIWGVSVENLWIFITSVLGIVAVGFFAMWSLLSNITATLFLFLVNPFKIDDEIVILSEEIRGVVVDLTALFIVIEDENGDMIQIPSNYIFQKTIKKVNKDSTADPD